MLDYQINVRLSLEDKKILDSLSKELGESKSAVLKRALNFYKSEREKRQDGE